jgi:hypothetical protein
MTDYFLDEAATGSNNGLSTDNAFPSWTAAVAQAYSAGDYLWVRRTTNDVQGADLVPNTASDGTNKLYINIVGWPRPAIPNTTITAATFTNGSRLVHTITGITPDREKHVGRYITAPDGKQYLLTAILYEAAFDGVTTNYTVGSKLTNNTANPDRYGKCWAFTDTGDQIGTMQYTRDSAVAWLDEEEIVDAAGGHGHIEDDTKAETAIGFLIDRLYPSATVSGTDGAFQIEADDDWTYSQTIDDSAWTTKLSDGDAHWNNDAIDLPIMDFDDGAYQFYNSSGAVNWMFKNIEFKDSTDTNGILYAVGVYQSHFIGCLFKQTTANAYLLYCSTAVYLERCIFEGSGAGTSQHGTYGAGVFAKNVASYNVGGRSFFLSGGKWFNTNMGVEIPNLTGDLYTVVNCHSAYELVDCECGSSTTLNISDSRYPPAWPIAVENYQKTLGRHRSICTYWDQYSTAVVAGSGDPEKRTGGADTVIKAVAASSSTQTPVYAMYIPCPIFTHEFETDGTSKTYTYYVQSLMTLDNTQIWLEAEYVDVYDDTDEYHITRSVSGAGDVSITARADATDWADYVRITVDPATASKVRLRLHFNYYHASNYIYIDPLCVIS